MNIIRKIGQKILYLKRCYHWYECYKKYCVLPRRDNYIEDISWLNEGRILLIAPHADDELLSSYSLLTKAKNIVVYYCGFTGSNHEESNRIIRKNEIEAVCKNLNIPIFDGCGACYNLKEVLTAENFKSIVIPSIVDWHPEHRKVSYILYNIMKEINITPKIYSYSVTVPNESKRKISCVPLTKVEFKKKYELFKRIYKSQLFMPLYRFKINERINGYNINMYAAEVFCYYELNEWKENTLVFMSAESVNDKRLIEMSISLGESLGNLEELRILSSNMYHCFENRELFYG